MATSQHESRREFRREPGPVDVVTALPRRRPGSIRRTASFDVLPDPGWDRGVVDRAVDDDGAARLLATAGIGVDLDEESTIRGLRADVSPRVRGAVVGSRVVGGTPNDERGLLGMAFHPDFADNGNPTSTTLTPKLWA